MTGSAHRLTEWFVQVVAAYQSGRPLALMFDYDGTLTPIVAHPSLAELPAANRDRLTRLATLPDVALAVISGRALAEVQDFVGIAGLYYAGSGGQELDLRGRRVEYPGAETFRRTQDAMIAAVEPVLARFPGTWIERKPVALAIHYRALAPAAAVRFRLEISEMLNQQPGQRHREVSESIEVSPATGWDKGTAVETILEEHGSEVLPVYFGDAANDAEAMAVAALMGGFAIGVGPDAPPTATHRLVSPAEVEVWLDRLVQALPPARGLPPPHPRAAAAPHEPPTRPDPEPNHGPGVLVVEAESATRDACVAAFQHHGWRVWTAADADSACALLQTHLAAIHAAVVDLQLPGLQGIRALTELGHLSPDLARFGMTADVSTYAAAAFRQVSSVPLFTKPLDVSAVVTALHDQAVQAE